MKSADGNPYESPRAEPAEPLVEEAAVNTPPRPFKLSDAPVLWVMALATIVALIFSVLSWLVQR